MSMSMPTTTCSSRDGLGRSPGWQQGASPGARVLTYLNDNNKSRPGVLLYNVMILSTTFLILAIVALALAVVLLIKPWWVAAVPAAVALLLLIGGNYITYMPVWKTALWVGAAVVVAVLRRLLPAGEPDGRNTSNLYIGLSALAGALLGMAMGSNYILLGTIVGAFIGMMAYSRTPAGAWVKSGYVKYFAHKCLPAIVAAALVGTCVEGIIYYFNTVYNYL